MGMGIFSSRDFSHGDLVVFARNNIKYSLEANAHVDGFHLIQIKILIGGEYI